MFIWLHKSHASALEGDVMLSFDPPDPDEADDWLLLTTRERHFEEIARELEKNARQYDKSGDYKSKRISTDLAATLRSLINAPTQVN